MKFFDCNICFGAAMRPAMKQTETAEALLEEMDFCGIDDALVLHAATRDDFAGVGNRLVVEGTKAHRRLHPSWAILPPQTEELSETITQFLKNMRKHGVWALRAFPKEHRFLLNDTTFHDLFDEMERSHVPLILDGDWAMIEQLLRERPKLTVVALQLSNHGQDRMFRPLVEKYANFHLDTGKYQCDGGIAAFCKKYGPERLLYGSGFPAMPLGPGKLEILHADIPDSEKELIASGNLVRLMKEVRL